MLLGGWPPGRRADDERRRTAERLAEKKRRQDELERIQRALAAQVERLRRRVEEGA